MIKIYRQKMRQNPLLNHIGTPSQKFLTERIMPETNQNRIPAVRMTCIVRDMLLVSCVRMMRTACGTWQTAIQMPAIEEVIVNGSMNIKMLSVGEKSHSLNEYCYDVSGERRIIVPYCVTPYCRTPYCVNSLLRTSLLPYSLSVR